MLTSPRINKALVSTSHVFFNLQRRKYTQYYTTICNVQYLACGVLNAKIPYLARWPSVQGYEFPSTLVPCWESITPFPMGLWPHPFPQAHFFKSTHPHMWYNLNWQKTTSTHQKSSWFDTVGTPNSSPGPKLRNSLQQHKVSEKKFTHVFIKILVKKNHTPLVLLQLRSINLTLICAHCM